MTAPRFRVGLVGTRRGTSPVRPFALCPETEVAALGDLHEARLVGAGRAFGLPDRALFTSYDAMPASDVDVVGVGTPIPFHADQAVGAAVRQATPEAAERPWSGDEGTLSANDAFGTDDDLERSPFARAYRRWAEDPTPLSTFGPDLRALRIGDGVARVSNQAEFFVALGLGVKVRSPFRHTFLAFRTNGSVGSVPTRRAFAEGGYGAKKDPGNSFLAVEAGERMVEASVERLRRAGTG